MPLNQTILALKSVRYHDGLRKTANFAMGSQEYKQTAFLCHSHKDESLVKGLLVLFEDLKIKLYVDLMDSEMP